MNDRAALIFMLALALFASPLTGWWSALRLPWWAVFVPWAAVIGLAALIGTHRNTTDRDSPDRDSSDGDSDSEGPRG